MTNNPAALNLTHLSRHFGGVKAVNQVSLTVKPGEIYALIGPNGAGKTTMVKLITGLLPPSGGSIEIFGIDVWTDPVHAKRLLGYIPDEPFIYNYLTAREFLELTGDLHGLARDTTQARIKELAQLYQVEDLMDGLFSDFSRGNKQKTTIMAALIHRPRILIIDEPIVGLDAQSQQITKEMLQKFAADGGSVLVCTHTLTVAQEIAHRIGILNEGRLLTEGTLTQLRKFAHSQHNDLQEIYLKLCSPSA